MGRDYHPKHSESMDEWNKTENCDNWTATKADQINNQYAGTNTRATHLVWNNSRPEPDN